MFNINDKVELVAINGINKNGKFVPLMIKFPFEEIIIIPEDVISISIMESHNENGNIFGYTVFKIYVGNVTTIREICNNKENPIFFNKVFENFEGIDQPLVCFNNQNNQKVVTGILTSSDIVVENTDKLKEVLLSLSDEMTNIRKSVANVRKLQFKKNKNK